MLKFDDRMACSGTIYSDYWVLTAAHCIGVPDLNNDRQIGPGEAVERYTVTPGPNANGQAVAVPVSRIFPHPQGAFGSYEGVDVAMIWLGDPGFHSSWLSGSAYSNGKMNIDPVSASNLQGMSLLNSGYGYLADNANDGVLRYGWKRVVFSGVGWYWGEPIDGAGISCRGDSGGTDRRWTGAAWVVTGIHSTGTHDGCIGGYDTQNGQERWAAWVNSMGNWCPATTRRGRCHF